METGREQARVAALHALDVLDSEPESDFDELAALAAAVCGTPMAGLGLIDTDRHWFKASVGLDVRVLPRDISFCARAVETPAEILEVPDASADARFADNPLVQAEPRVRFYAGAPLVTPQGHAVGSLCVLDTVPRRLSDEQREALRVLGRQAAVTLELRAALRAARHALRAREVAEARFGRLFREFPSGIAVVDASGTYVEVNDALARLLRRPAHDLVGRHDSTLTLLADQKQERALASRLMEGLDDQVVRQKRYLRADGSVLHALVTTSVVRASTGGPLQFLSQVQSIEDRRRAERDLLEMQSAHDGIISIDGTGLVRNWNAGAERVFGYSADEMVGRPLLLIIPERLRQDHRAGLARALAGEPARLVGTTVDVPAVRRDGTEITVELSLSTWTRDGARFFTAILRDVTDARRAAADAALVQLAATIGNESDSLDDALRQLLPRLVSGGTCSWSRAWPPGGRRGASAGPGSDTTTAPDGSRDPGEGRVLVDVLASGRPVTVLELAVPSAARPGLRDTLTQVAGHLSRVAEREQARGELARLALADQLTGLPNRLRLMQLAPLLERTQHGATLALLFLDVDRLKVVNDSLGHHVGDLLLRGLAARLRGQLRPGDVLVRMGGDEFVVVCPALPDAAAAEAVALRLLAALREPLLLDGTPVHGTVSIGLATATDECTVQTLLRHADHAMYRSKAQGGACYTVFDAAMQGQVDDRLTREEELATAVDTGSFVLHYQPVVDVRTGHVWSVEALVRMVRPDGSLVGPAAFVQMAEDIGLAVRLGQWVLPEAVRQLAAWGPSAPPAVNVNVTTPQLRQADFAADVLAALERHGVPPTRLVLELTESVFLDHDEAVIRALHALRAAGVRVALDDFGTGYSCLGYLSRLPVDSLKIDKTFTDRIERDGLPVVEAVLTLASAYGLEVVAEGVETPLQRGLLLAAGCRKVQGYLYSRPVPADEVPRLTRLGLAGVVAPAPGA